VRRALVVVATVVAASPGCAPDVGRDPVPEAMEFDPEAMPPRVPEPTGLILNPMTGKLDFSLAGIAVPADCANQTAMAEAQCEFYQYLQGLDGFPTVTPARAPTTAELDLTTATRGENVVVVRARGMAALGADELGVGFDSNARYLTIAPRPAWDVREFYWMAVRGYDRGVRAIDGSQVVGSPTMALLKQDTPLTCDVVATPAEIPADCPTLLLLAEGRSDEVARATVFRLERVRLGYAAGQGWELMEQVGGIPKSEVAVLWGFPIHTNSVAELDPLALKQPNPVAADQIDVVVKGPVDPATVSAFVVAEQMGPVVLMDLTAAAEMDLVAGFPRISARYDETTGAIVIKGAAPFVTGHTYGVFLLKGIHDERGEPLAAPPVSVFLSARGPLVDAAGKSTVSTIDNDSAARLEAGRLQLKPLFDSGTLSAVAGISRSSLAYVFAFEFPNR
jgi:hypothetical protein